MTLQEFDIKSGNLSWFNINVKSVMLECIDIQKNHKKYYHLHKLNVDNYIATYGRIGNNAQKKDYKECDKCMWDLFKEKLKKGYKIKYWQLYSDKDSRSFKDFLIELERESPNGDGDYLF